MIWIAGCLCLGGCPDEQKKPRAPADAGKPLRPDAPPERFAHCAELKPRPAPVSRLRLAGTELIGDGYWLRPRGSRTPPRKLGSPRRLRLGVVGDPQQALGGTLSNLSWLRRRFARARVDAIVVVGGLDPDPAGTSALLRRLRGRAPLLVLPGDRVARDTFSATMRRLAPRAVDLSLSRVVALPQALVVSVPGYFQAHYLLAKERGCGYTPEDITRLLGVVRRLPGPKLLLSHGPPRGAGPDAVDRAFGGFNVGDTQLEQLMTAGNIRFGLFAHVHEAVGHATTLDGVPVEAGRWSTSLLLNVGSADAVSTERLDGGWSPGSAALFDLRGRRARYRMLSLPRSSYRQLRSPPGRSATDRARRARPTRQPPSTQRSKPDN